jgi:lysophospholipase L1-like esterase
MWQRHSPEPPDWPRYRQYREANRTAPKGQTVCLGDSIIKKWEGAPCVNRGASGQTTAQMLVRFRPDVINLEPKAVIIMGGTNDISVDWITEEETRGNIASMCELAKTHNIKVYLVSVLPVSAEQSKIRPLERINSFNDWMKDYARENEHTFLDFHSRMVGSDGFIRPELSDDGLHPNPEGYRLFVY